MILESPFAVSLFLSPSFGITIPEVFAAGTSFTVEVSWTAFINSSMFKSLILIVPSNILLSVSPAWVTWYNLLTTAWFITSLKSPYLSLILNPAINPVINLIVFSPSFPALSSNLTFGKNSNELISDTPMYPTQGLITAIPKYKELETVVMMHLLRFKKVN